MVARVGGGVVKAMEGSVVDSGGLEWSGGSVVFLDRNWVKVFVVEKSVCWAFRGELGVG